MSSNIVQRKKKLNWILWLILFFVFMVAGYYISGIFTFKDLSLSNYGEKLTYILKHPFNNYINEKTKYILLLMLMSYLVALSYALSNLKNYMPGKEMGSAEWGEIKRFNKELEDRKGGDNMVLSQKLRKAYDTKLTLLNNNITCIGGSGAGKTAGFVGPNLLQFHGSSVYPDPKGDTLKDFGNVLISEGIRVRVINLIEMWKSHKYNPFRYINKMGDLRRLITNIIANTTPAEANKGDPFWDKAESLYLTGVFSYVWRECDDVPYYKYVQLKSNSQDPVKELAGCIEHEEIAPRIWKALVVDDNGEPMRLKKTFRTVLILLDEAAVSDDEDRMSELDCRMEELRIKLIEAGKKPMEHPALKNYYRAIRGAGDTIRSIIISANARFAPFDDDELLNILDGDDIDLPSLGIGINGDQTTRTALFVVIPDDDTTYNFIPGMLYTQMFQELYRVSHYYGNKLPIEVGFWFDEFANIKMPNDFDKILATCRSRNIYIVIILQSLAQIKDLYKDKWEGIIGNCDTIIYLGGNEQSSHKYFSELLGKWTIDKRTTGMTFGSHGSTSRNEDILGRELMTPDEIKNMPNEDSLIFVRGQNPIYDKKMYWFKQKEFEHIKDFDSYQFIPLVKKQFEVLNEQAIDYIKRDNTKDVVEYDFNSLGGFLSIDFGVADKKSEEEIRKQMEEIETGRLEITDINLEESDISSHGAENLLLEDIIINEKLEAEQINALTEAAIEGVPENVLKELIEKKVTAERINIITEIYKRREVQNEQY